MTTDRKPVMVYLPEDVELTLTEYCQHNNLTKTYKTGEVKPSFGTAIIQILTQVLTSSQSNTGDWLQNIVKEYKTDKKEYNTEYITQIDIDIDQLIDKKIEEKLKEKLPSREELEEAQKFREELEELKKK